MNYRLHPAAAAEHKRQIAYYEEKQAGLGRRYHAEYLATLALALEAPHRYKIILKPSIRRKEEPWTRWGSLEGFRRC